MRLLLIHQAFVSPGDPGGKRHYEFARHCVREGHQVTVIASDVSWATGRRTNPRGTQDLDGIRVLRAYTHPSYHRSYAWRAFALMVHAATSFGLALRAGPVDVVMGTCPPIFQLLSSWLIAFLRRRPFLLEIRDLYVDGAIEEGILKNRLLIALARGFERFMLRRAAHVLVNSPAYRRVLIEQKGLDPSRVSLIPNGVDPDMFDPQERGEAIRQALGLGGKFVVVYAGAMGLDNDLATIVRAANRLRDHPDIHFVLVGDGKERPAAEALSKELGLSNLTFTGARPKAEMPQFLGAADACVATLADFPVLRTTYPNKVFDYLAAGRPIVLGIEGVIREVMEAARCGIGVPHSDPAALAEAVLQLQSNPEQARKMGRAGREYVVEHFDRRRHAAEFLQMAQEIAKRRPVTVRT